MSTTTVIMKADAGELITDMFKRVFDIMQHPDVNILIIEHNNNRFTIIKEEIE